MNLATQLVTSPHFRWLPGMYGFSPSQDLYQRYAGIGVWVDGDIGFIRAKPAGDLQPVLPDAATQGGLLQLVQEAYKAPRAYVKWDAMTGEYLVSGFPVLKIVRGPSAGEVLAKALLEAP